MPQFTKLCLGNEDSDASPTLARRAAHCLRCGYQWSPRVEHPVSCPHCFSNLWDTPRAQKRAGQPAPTRKGKPRGVPFDSQTGARAAAVRFGDKPGDNKAATLPDSES